MTAGLRFRSTNPVDEAAQVGRRVRDLAVAGSTQLASRADVPRFVEACRDGAAAVFSDAVERVTGRRRRRRNSLVSAALIGLLLALCLSAWWLFRSSGSIAALRALGEDELADDDLGALDAQALPGTADGMRTASATATAGTPAIPVPPEGGPAEADDLLGELAST